MADKIAAVKAYVRAFCGEGQQASDEASKYIAQDVDLVSPPLHVYGHAGIMERISGHWPGMGMYQSAKWAEPKEQGDQVVAYAQMQPGLPTESITITFDFNAEGLIKHVDAKQVRAATPPPPAELKMSQEVKDLVNNSLDDGCPMTVGYVGEDGQPQLTIRGSMRAISDTQIAFWVRNPNGGVVKALSHNPKLTVLYRDTPNRVNMTFMGIGRVETDEKIRNAVFDSMPQIEQDHDEPRRGACMVIDLESVNGATFSGPVRMQKKR